MLLARWLGGERDLGGIAPLVEAYPRQPLVHFYAFAMRRGGGRMRKVMSVVPQQILIQPAAREYGLHREQYQALAADLEGEGVLVRLLPAVAGRGLRTGGSQNAGASYDLTIQVGAVAGEIIGLAELVEMVRGQLRRHEGREDEERRGNIYLANGEEHAFVFGYGYD